MDEEMSKLLRRMQKAERRITELEANEEARRECEEGDEDLTGDEMDALTGGAVIALIDALEDITGIRPVGVLVEYPEEEG